MTHHLPHRLRKPLRRPAAISNLPPVSTRSTGRHHLLRFLPWQRRSYASFHCGPPSASAAPTPPHPHPHTNRNATGMFVHRRRTLQLLDKPQPRLRKRQRHHHRTLLRHQRRHHPPPSMSTHPPANPPPSAPQTPPASEPRHRAPPGPAPPSASPTTNAHPARRTNHPPRPARVRGSGRRSRPEPPRWLWRARYRPAPVYSGAGRALVSTLPLTVSGNASRTMIAAGTM